MSACSHFSQSATEVENNLDVQTKHLPQDCQFEIQLLVPWPHTQEHFQTKVFLTERGFGAIGNSLKAVIDE